MENYGFVKRLGRGSFGDVWLIEEKSTRKRYVLKQIQLKNASSKERLSAAQEVHFLSTLHHPNIVTYYKSFHTYDGILQIIMGYCEGGDMYRYIQKRKNSYICENEIAQWFIQICMALQYLHEVKILHRDLKTQNIFLTRRKLIKIGDFGIARVLDGTLDMATTLIGTPYYMSPELFSNKPYNYKSDIWALGCCIAEMTTLKHAFNANDLKSLMYKVLMGEGPVIPSIYSSDLSKLIYLMLSSNPEERPSAFELLQCEYVKKHIKVFLDSTEHSFDAKSHASTVQVPLINDWQLDFKKHNESSEELCSSRHEPKKNDSGKPIHIEEVHIEVQPHELMENDTSQQCANFENPAKHKQTDKLQPKWNTYTVNTFYENKKDPALQTTSSKSSGSSCSENRLDNESYQTDAVRESRRKRLDILEELSKEVPVELSSTSHTKMRKSNPPISIARLKRQLKKLKEATYSCYSRQTSLESDGSTGKEFSDLSDKDLPSRSLILKDCASSDSSVIAAVVSSDSEDTGNQEIPVSTNVPEQRNISNKIPSFKLKDSCFLSDVSDKKRNKGFWLLEKNLVSEVKVENSDIGEASERDLSKNVKREISPNLCYPGTVHADSLVQNASYSERESEGSEFKINLMTVCAGSVNVVYSNTSEKSSLMQNIRTPQEAISVKKETTKATPPNSIARQRRRERIKKLSPLYSGRNTQNSCISSEEDSSSDRRSSSEDAEQLIACLSETLTSKMNIAEDLLVSDDQGTVNTEETRLQQRIASLKRDCESLLGLPVYEDCYNMIKATQDEEIEATIKNKIQDPELVEKILPLLLNLKFCEHHAANFLSTNLNEQ